MGVTLSRNQRFKLVIDWFEKNVPIAETELHYSNPYELTVAVILSAQCTDKRVNMTTPAFFQKFPDVYTLSHGTEEEVFNLIKSCTFPNNKTKHLLGMATKIVNEFGGHVPDDTGLLQTLPGVGRKTANVIASVAFEKPALAVDTHVHRVAARLGLTVNAKTPLATEQQLVKYIPENRLNIAHHWLILHGRYICVARKPKCHECGLRQVCKFYQKLTSETSIKNQ